MNSADGTPDGTAEGETVAPPTATELLRTALVNDDDPRFPWWLPVPGLLLALAWAGYHAAVAAAGTGEEPLDAFVQTLVWPGAGLFILATAATWFGWQLEID
jgi:hypothetical protein